MTTLHDPSRWGDKLWSYYPINYHPDLFHNLTSWWLDKVPLLGDKIMEVGCWSALSLIWLKKNFPNKDIIGVDVNGMVVHSARTRAFYNGVDVPIYRGDGFNLAPFGDKTKDILFSDGLVEHFDEPERIKLMTEHLRVAKKVLFVVPVAEGLVEGTGYGDERKLTFQQWSEFTQKYFVVEEEFTNDPKEHYACIIRGEKQ